MTGDRASRRFLIVDDEPVFSAFALRQLSKAGHEVESVASTRAALERIVESSRIASSSTS